MKKDLVNWVKQQDIDIFHINSFSNYGFCASDVIDFFFDIVLPLFLQISLFVSHIVIGKKYRSYCNVIMAASLQYCYQAQTITNKLTHMCTYVNKIVFNIHKKKVNI